MSKVHVVHRASAGLCVLALVLEILGYTCPGWLLVTTDLSILTQGTSISGFGQVSSRAGVWYVDVCVKGDSSEACTHSSDHEPREMGFRLSQVFADVSRIDWRAVQAVLTMALLFCSVGAIFAFLGLCSTKSIGDRTSTLIAAAGMLLSALFILPALVIVGTAMNTSKDKANTVKETTGKEFVQFDIPWALVLSAFGLIASFVCSLILAFITYQHHGKQKHFTEQYGDIVPPAVITSGRFPANIARVRMSIDDEVVPPVFKKLRGYNEDTDEILEQNEDDAGSKPPVFKMLRGYNEDTDEILERYEDDEGSKPFVHPPPSKTLIEGQHFHVGDVPLLPFKASKIKAQVQTERDENGITEDNEKAHKDNGTDQQTLNNAIVGTESGSTKQNINKLKTHSSAKSASGHGTNRPPSRQKAISPAAKNDISPSNKVNTLKYQESKMRAQSAQNSAKRSSKPSYPANKNTTTVKSTKGTQDSMKPKTENTNVNKVSIEAEKPLSRSDTFLDMVFTPLSGKTTPKELPNRTSPQHSKTDQETESALESKEKQTNKIQQAQSDDKKTTAQVETVPPKTVPGYAKLTKSQLIRLEARKNVHANITSSAAKPSVSMDKKSTEFPVVKEEKASKTEKKTIINMLSTPVKRIVSRNDNTATDKAQDVLDLPKHTDHAKGKDPKKGFTGPSSPSVKTVKHPTSKAKSKKKHATHKSDQGTKENAKKKKTVRRKIKRRHRTHGKKDKQDIEQDDGEEEYETESSSDDEDADKTASTKETAAEIELSDPEKVPVIVMVTECKLVETHEDKEDVEKAGQKRLERPLRNNGKDERSTSQELIDPDSNNENTKYELETANDKNGSNPGQQRVTMDTDTVDGENGRHNSVDKGSNGQVHSLGQANSDMGLPRVSSEADGICPISFDQQSSDTSSVNTVSSDRKNSDTISTGHT